MFSSPTATDLESATFAGIKHKKPAQNPLTVCRHVEGYTVLPPQHSFTQLLENTCISKKCDKEISVRSLGSWHTKPTVGYRPMWGCQWASVDLVFGSFSMLNLYRGCERDCSYWLFGLANVSVHKNKNESYKKARNYVKTAQTKGCFNFLSSNLGIPLWKYFHNNMSHME